VNRPRLLVACEFSGVVREAFKSQGWDAWSCDLLPSDIPGNHFQDNVLKHLNDGWDMMIAHPPCTDLCLASNANLHRDDRQYLNVAEKRESAFNFVMKLAECPIEKIAIENPIGYLNKAWRKPDQVLRPYMFGHPYRKDICLWLKNLPLLNPTYALYPPKPWMKLDFWSDKRNPNGRSLKSITFQGLAQAMAQQWGNLKALEGKC
jgi:hypothetical protein